MKIIAYSVLEYHDVNDLIKLGWQPYGSPILYQDSIRQAVVKYETPEVSPQNGYNQKIQLNVGTRDIQAEAAAYHTRHRYSSDI